MDQKPISEETRKILYNHLADVMLESIENNTMSYEDGQESSDYILQRFDDLKTYPEVLQFLEDLTKKWPPYSSVLLYLKKLEQEHNDEKQVDKIEDEIKHLT